MNLKDYLKLLDWTSQQGHKDARQVVPSELQSLVSRIGIDGSMLAELVWRFKKYFGIAPVLIEPLL
jgi:hypothetical protein